MPQRTTLRRKRPATRRPKIITRNGTTKAVLDNGLTVIVRESHNAPVSTFWCWYKVGSRVERPGITGVSHWVEHMLFKGTPAFPKRELDRMISREGGMWNGFTWLDFTTYFETLPADRFDLAFSIESDRMVHAVFDPKEVASERTVIISERQGNENSPQFLLAEEVQAAAFRVHGYHHEVIGDLCDLQTMTRDQLYQSLPDLLRAQQRRRRRRRRFQNRRCAEQASEGIRQNQAGAGTAADPSRRAAAKGRAAHHGGRAGHDSLRRSGLSRAAGHRSRFPRARRARRDPGRRVGAVGVWRRRNERQLAALQSIGGHRVGD